MGEMIKYSIAPGCLIGFAGSNYIIKRVLDLQRVLLENVDTRYIVQAEIKDLKEPITEGDTPASKPLTDDPMLFSEEEWSVAIKRLKIIEPVISNRLSTDEIKIIAKTEGVHFSTIYRWVERYKSTNQTSSLVPEKRAGVEKTKRLDKDVEAIVKGAIEDVYLTKQKKSVQKVCLEVIRRCDNAGLIPPSAITIRRRIDAISDEHKMKSRLGKEISRTKYEPIRGHFPGADHPLAVVQIDHTKLDVILVDPINRKPIDRPWITVAIDVFSRMIIGFYVSFDPPGALGTGMCLSNAILPKEMYLLKNEIEGEWPCWGVMDTIHADNAKEFRGNMLKRVAEEYGINLQWRPVKRPNWGGHIERLLGTVLKEIKELPGTTFSNPRERGNYNSEGTAALTLKELEKWLLTYIISVYHNRFHNGIGMSPLSRFNEGIFGNSKNKGRGIPPRIFNERKVRLDFLPFLERTIQEYGVQIDHITYYDDKLRPYINTLENDSKKSRQRRKFIFKRDPRDISVIYFHDPELNCYFDIPYRDISHPGITIWEYNAVERWLINQGKKNIDERSIFEGYEQMRRIEDNAVEKKRIAQRNKTLVKRQHSMENSFKNSPENLRKAPDDHGNLVKSETQAFKPFDDIEI